MYVSANGTFLPGPQLPKSVYEHCSVRLNETHAIITGGDEFSTKLRNVYMFNMINGDYEELPRMKLARAGGLRHDIRTSHKLVITA